MDELAVNLNDLERSCELPDISPGPISRKVHHMSSIQNYSQRSHELLLLLCVRTEVLFMVICFTRPIAPVVTTIAPIKSKIATFRYWPSGVHSIM